MKPLTFSTALAKKYSGSKLEKTVRSLGLNKIVYSAYYLFFNIFLAGKKTAEINGVNINYIVSEPEDLIDEHNPLGEKDVIIDFIEELQDGDVFYDIGSNRGIYSLLAGKSGKKVEIYGFEPNPQLKSRIEKNLKINGVEAKVIDVGLSDSYESKKLSDLSSVFGENEMEGNFDLRKGNKLIKDKEISSPSIIKIDIEGGEIDALKGLESNLDGCRVLYIEVHPEMLDSKGQSEEELKELLDKKGFELTKISSRDKQKHYKARLRS